MINFYILTLFPEFFDAFKNHSIIKKGLGKNLFSINVKNLRDHALNKYGQVDDAPYGGGSGMLLRPEPVIESFDDLKLDDEEKKVIYLSPKGKKIDYKYINNLTYFKNIVLICGHYEGMDERVITHLKCEEVSIGDFVLTGGELPAMIVMDSTVRQIEGVIKKDSLKDETFTHGLLEHRQYTRPDVYRGMSVPEILISGHHKNIEKFKLEDSIRETLLKRPDLLDGLLRNKDFSDNIIKLTEKIKKEIENEHY